MQGAKRMFIVGIVIYGAGTLTAAVAWNIGVLILGWSIIEGIAAALILPLAMTLIFFNYTGAKRALAFGILGGVQASASAVGPILGGFLTTYFSWKWGFGLQVIIVAIIFFFVKHIKESEKLPISLDWRGTILSTTGLMLIVLGFLLAGQYGFWVARRPFTIGDVQVNPFGLSPTPILILLGVGVLLAFAHWQSHLNKTGRTPLLQLKLLTNGGFMSGVATDTFRQLALTGLLFIIPVFTQQLLGFSAIKSGLAILPFSAGVFILSMSTANLARRVAPKWLINAGIVVYIAGILWM
jgi:MFS family permease